MKNIIAVSFFVVAIASISLSCKKTQGPTPKLDSLVFGRYDPASMTPIPNGQFYELKNNMLYAYPILYLPAGVPLIKQKLPDSLYAIARYLIDNFPQYLIQHPNDKAIGGPGCWGEKVITLSAFSDTVTTGWQISTDTSRLPKELRKYIWRAGVIIDQL